MKRTKRSRRPTPRASHRTPPHGDVKFSIDVVNQQNVLRVATSKLRSLARFVLREEGVPAAHIELALVDDATIKRVHRRFLGLDTPTDVLTFPFHEPHEPLAGQIVLSVETAARVGPAHGLTAEDEVLLYAIHGILHLCGYDDRSARAARRMRRRQEQLLHAFFTQEYA
jgi:probable rRNA maturation factor